MAFEVSPDEISNTFVQLEEFAHLLQKLGGVEGLASRLQTDLKNGLSESEERENFKTRRKHFGDNTFPEKPRNSWFVLWYEAMQDTTLILLSLAATISLVVGIFLLEDKGGGGSWIEGLAILFAVLFMNCVMATNEYQKESQFLNLNKLEGGTKKSMSVIRGGRKQEVEISEIFVGDIVVIDCGDIIPADGIVIQASHLTVDESVMTGEPVSLHKSPDGDYRMLSGCQCYSGSGRMLVVATGERSQWGIISKLFAYDRSETITPLQEKLDEMAENIGLVGLSIAVLVFCILIYQFVVAPGEDEDSFWKNLKEIVDFFILVVVIVVVFVPEGFCFVVTVSLASSLVQVVKHNNLVRKMGACETMGSVTDLCFENTGTLTENKRTLKAGWIAGEEFQEVPPNLLQVQPEVLRIIHESIAVNSSPSTSIEMREDLPPKFVGNQRECALLMFSVHCGYDYEEIRRNSKVTKEYPFSSRKKRSCVVPSGVGHRLYCMGASEIVLRDCANVMRGDGEQIPLTEEMKDQLLEYVNSLVERDLQTLCLACRSMHHYDPDVEVNPSLLEQDLTVLAIVGIGDPIRKGIPETVTKCQNAGVVVRMVTTDRIGFANMVAEEVGILTKGGLALEGHKFAKMSDAEIDEVIPRLQVLARSMPMDKVRLIQRLKANKRVVAVGGSGGCSDSVLFRNADVGLAGIDGTDVAKEASDIIILDNFNSCVYSILWGRCIFYNICKFVQFWMTGVISMLLVVLIGVLSRRGSPFAPIQLLWINVILETAALALGTEKPHPGLLERPPVNQKKSLFSNIMIKNIVGQVIYQFLILCFIMFGGKYIWYVEDESDLHYTYLFNSFVFAQLFNEINSRRCNGEPLNVFENFFTNQFLVRSMAVIVILQFLMITFGGAAFRCVPLDLEGWLVTVLIGFGSIPLGLILRVIPVPVNDGWGFFET